MKEHLNDSLSKIDWDDIDIESNIDEEISNDIKDFYIDIEVLDKIELPKDIKKQAIKPMKEIKKEKKKNIRYAILDILIVLIFISPIAGVMKPEIFKNIPQVYSVLVKVNKTLQKDNIMSLLGFNHNYDSIEGNIESSKNTEYILESDVEIPQNSYDEIKLIHSLANTLVQAEYKWECSEVTPKTIEIALQGIELIKDDYDRMHLRNSLKKWVKGDFSDSVEVHNYVWDMLDGSVGKAEKLDNEEINKVIDKYYGDVKNKLEE